MEVPTLGTLRPDARSPREAREAVRGLLEGTDRAVVEAVLLAVSELVTNAVEHAGTNVELRAGVVDGRLRVEVADGSGELPHPRRPAPQSRNGRGLLLVEQVADAWGVSPTSTGKAVWFERRLFGRD